MVRIINAFQGDSPLGTVISNLGQQLWGNGAAGEINRQNALALQRSNTETENLMRYIAENGGVQANGANPIVQAMLLGSGYAPQDFARIGLMGAATGAGARDPSTINWTVGAGLPYANTAEAFDLNLAETARNNNMASADRRYATDQTVAENARQFDMTPTEAVVNGVPVYVPRAGAFDAGVSPVLTQSEAQGVNLMTLFPNLPRQNQIAAIGAEPSLVPILTPDNQIIYVDPTTALGQQQPVDPFTLGAGEVRYGPNGEPIAQGGPAQPSTTWNYIVPGQNGQPAQVFLTNNEMFARGLDAQGNPLPPGGSRGELTGTADQLGLTNAQLSNVQGNEIALQRFNVVADELQRMLDDPSSQWGVVGWAQNKAQEILQAVGSVVDLIKPEDAAVVRQFLPELYNPNLPAQQTIHALIVYLGASALAGQDGRSVSDADIRRFEEAFPDPFGLFSSRASVQASLDVVRNIVNQYQDLNRNALQQGVGGTPAPTADPGAAPAPQAPQTNNLGWTTADITVENVRDTAAALNISFEDALRQIAESFGIPYAEAFQILQANTPTGQ